MNKEFQHEGYSFKITGTHPNYSCYLVDDADHFVCMRRTQKECKDLVRSKSHENIVEALEFKAKREKKNAEFPAKQHEFLKLFGFKAPIDMFSRHFFLTHRISVIQLDKMLRVPDGKSTRDYIDELYGIKAVKLVESMM